MEGQPLPGKGGEDRTLPYTLGTNGYPVASRCNVLAGCTGQPLDHVGVRVTYRHTWRTPFGTAQSS